MPASSARKLKADKLRLHLVEQAGNWELSGEEEAAAAEASFDRLDRALLVPTERIAPMKDNPRQTFRHLDELAESIAAEGVIQPLIVRRDPGRSGYYMTVAGARRVMAANILRGHEDPAVRARVAALPCVVVDESDDRALAKALAENLARDDLTRGEAMEAVLRLERQYGWSGNRIAKTIGRNQPDVAEMLRVAKDPELGVLVREETISPSAAGEITRLPLESRPAVIAEVRAGRLRSFEDIKAINPNRGRLRRPRPGGGAPSVGGVSEFTNPWGSEQVVTEGSEFTSPTTRTATNSEKRAGKSANARAQSPSEQRDEEVRRAKELSEALRAIVEPHPLIGWEEEVRPSLEAIYDSRAKLSGKAAPDEVLPLEDVRCLFSKLRHELEAACAHAEGYESDHGLRETAQAMRAALGARFG